MATNRDQLIQQVINAQRTANNSATNSDAWKQAVAQSNQARSQLGNDIPSYLAKGNRWQDSLAGYQNEQTQNQIAQQTSDKQNQVNSIYDNLQKSRMEELKAQQQQATNQINQNKQEFHQQTVGQKNQASVASAQGAEKLREIMSSKGLLKSGENVTANVANNTARQNALNGLDQQFNNYTRNADNQIAAINDPNKAQAIIDELTAQRAQALYGAGNDAFSQALQLGQFNANQANNAWNQNFQETNNAWNQNFQQSQADQSQSNWDKSFNQQNNQFDQNMGWNYWSAQNTNAQAQAQAAAQIKAYQDMIAALGGGGNFNTASGGGGTTNSPGNYQQNLAQAVKVAGIPQNQLGAFNWIIQHESSYDPNALNKSSGTYGYGQFKPFNIASYDKKMGLDYRHNPVDQLVETYQYMVDRYGSPAKAMLAWKQKGWY